VRVVDLVLLALHAAAHERAQLGRTERFSPSEAKPFIAVFGMSAGVWIGENSNQMFFTRDGTTWQAQVAAVDISRRAEASGAQSG
jgi:hypothetical protein